MFHWWKHSWTTWRGRESLLLVHEIIGLLPCMLSSGTFRPKNRPICFNVKKSSPFPCDDTLAPPSHTFRKRSWLTSWAEPDLRTPDGRRDAVLLSVLYDTGARVQELIDLSVGDVRLDTPAQLRLLGKGRKMRAVPLMGKTAQLLCDHIREHHLDRPEQFDKPLFQNARKQRLSRSGIRYVLQKYLVKARNKRPSLNRIVSPHTLRHYLPFLTMSCNSVETPFPAATT
jgi:integrase